MPKVSVAQIILVTEMPILSDEATEALLDLVDDVLKTLQGPSKENLLAVLERERTLVNRNNALDRAKNLDETLKALRDNNPYIKASAIFTTDAGTICAKCVCPNMPNNTITLQAMQHLNH